MARSSFIIPSSVNLSNQQQDNSTFEPIDTSDFGVFMSTLNEIVPGSQFAFDKLVRFTKSFVDIADSAVDLGKFGISAQTPESFTNYMAKRIIAGQKGMSYEDFEETESNTIGLTALSRVLDKAIIKPPVDKETGKPLDYIDLFQRGEYDKVPNAFLQEVAGAAPSMIISRLPGGYALLGGTSFIDKLNKDLVERPDEDPANIFLNSIVYGGSDAIGEYFGGRFLNRLGGSFVKGATSKALIDKAKDTIIGGVGAIVKITLKGGSSEFAQEAITSVIQEAGDEIIYGDEKTKSDYFRKALHAGLIGFALGGTSGSISANMDQKNKRKFYEIVTNKSYKRKMTNLYKQEEEALEDLQNATNDQKKVFQKVVDDIRQERKNFQNEMYNKFDAYSESKWKEHFKNLDIQQQQLDIITGGRKYSNSAKERAKKLFLKAAKDNELAFNSDVDIKDVTEALESGITGRIAEQIRKRRDNLFFKAKDLKYEFIDNQEQFDKLKKDFGDDIATSTNGFFETNEGKIYINQAVAAVNESANVIGHELFHYAISNRFANDPKAMRDSIIAFRDYIKQLKDGEYILKQLDKKFIDGDYAQLDARGEVQYDKDGLVVMKREQDIEEYFTQFSDLIDNEQIESVEEASQGIKNSFRTLARGLGIGANKIDFKSGQEVFELLIDYNRNINRSGIAGAITQFGAIRSVSGKSKRRVARGIFSSKAQAKENLEKYAKDEKGDFKKELYDPNSEVIAKELPGMVKAQVDNYFNNRPALKVTSDQRGRQLRNEMISDVLLRLYDVSEKTGKSDVNSFDGRGSLYGYLNGRIKFRMLDHFKSSSSVVPDFTTQQLDEAKADLKQETVEQEQKEVKTERKKIVLAERLGITKQVAEAINKIVPNLDINKLTFKTLKNEIPEITGDLFGIATKKIESLANITKKELQSAQMFINKNADLLIAMLPEGVTASGTATGVPRTLLNEFYTKGERVKAAKTGSRAGLAVQQKNSNITKKQFLQVFGIVDGKPMRDDRNTSARVLALANLTGKMITNQAIRENLNTLGNSEPVINSIKEGKSEFMFSKNAQSSNVVFKNHNLPLLDVHDAKNGVENYNIFLDKMYLLSEYFPEGFIRRVDLFKFITYASPAYRYAESQSLELGDVFAIRGKVNGKNTNRSFHRPDTFLGKNIKEITKSKAEEYNKIGMENFNALIKGIKKAVEANPNDKQLHSAIMMYLSSSINDTSHALRGGAEYVGGDITATGKIIFEHAVQSARARDIIMGALLDKKQNFDETIKALKNNYKLIAMSKQNADELKFARYIDENGNEISYENGMGPGWDLFVDRFFQRYFNLDVNSINPEVFVMIKNGKTFAQEYGITKSGKAPVFNNKTKEVKIIDKAVNKARTMSFSKGAKGITILDFDDTLATTESLVKYTALDGKTGTLNAEQFASTYQDLQDLGYTFDFSDFNKVVKGKLAPLFNKALKLQKKFGPENMFVLTARPPAAQKPIFDFLKANGLNIPLKNITGLGNSTSEAKALWIADKVGEGYNDFYFADDALQNVQAVDNMLEQFDVKRKVQQAKIKFSKSSINKDFNDIIEDVKGIKSEKRYAQAKARKRGEGKGRFRFFVPPSHEDLVGLLYNFIGKGEKGNKHRDFFERTIVKPLNRAYNELNAAKQSIANDYRALIKTFPDVRKKLTKKTPDGDYYYSDAVRVYLWNKAGFDIPGMSKTDVQELVDLVTSDGELQAFADNIGVISKQEQGYIEPNEEWQAGDIRTDLADATGRVGRKKFFAEFIENADIIFNKENLNKIEAAYGIDFREALEDVLYRTKTGTNRTVGQNKIVNRFLDYLNGSIGATMFFNARSAVLQTISTVNFINFGDNNIFAAARAFANQKQFWSDFSMLFNSDMLKQRRAGVAFDVNANEIANAVSKSKQPVRAAIRYLLQIGFLPTQLADSFAISLGGASMYRNRVKTYLKQGLEQKEAETKAFNDFQEISESTQQSARPDKISQQQASPLGRMILAFQNTPSQYVRLMKKAALDLVNRRKTPPYASQAKSDMSNISKIIYYGAVQNIIFYSLQSAMFAMLFDDDEKDEEFFEKKRDRILNGSLDTILRGMGVGGAVISTIKNTAIKYAENQKKDWGKEDNVVMMEMLQLSPPIGIKARKISSAQKTMDFNKKVIEEMDTFDIDNPVYSAIGNLIEATTNIPLARLHRKTMNLREAANAENEWWQRLAMALGWSRWDVGVENKEVEEVKKKLQFKGKKRKRIKRIR